MICEAAGDMVDKRVREFEVCRQKGEAREVFVDQLVEEVPLTIYLNDKEIVTLLCTPDYLEELAVGFLVSEGFIRLREHLIDVKVDGSSGKAYVSSASTSLIAESTFLKRFITTGCGKGSSFYHLMDARQVKVPDSGFRVPGSAILDLMKQAQHRSELFLRTGGVHSAALCSLSEIVVFREDIGRHNATDKIVGKCFIEGIPLGDKMLLTTGRVSSEIIIKTAKLGIGILVSRSAPTSLAVDIARETGVTVVGFARGNRFNIYSFPERILDA